MEQKIETVDKKEVKRHKRGKPSEENPFSETFKEKQRDRQK